MKSYFLNVLMVMGLAACASQYHLGIGEQLAATWLNQECHGYIEKQRIWQLGKIALGHQAAYYKTQVCQCASQTAAKNMTTEQMIGLADEHQRSQILVAVIAPTVVQCYQELKNKSDF